MLIHANNKYKKNVSVSAAVDIQRLALIFQGEVKTNVFTDEHEQ